MQLYTKQMQERHIRHNTHSDRRMKQLNPEHVQQVPDAADNGCKDSRTPGSFSVLDKN